MVLIQSIDSDEKLEIQTYEETDAYAVSTTDVRSGIKMTLTPYTWGKNCLLQDIPTLQTLFWSSFGYTIWNVSGVFPSDIFDCALHMEPDILFAIYSDILSGILSGMFPEILATFYLASILIGTSLCLIYLQRFFQVEVRRGQQWSGACCSGSTTTSRITSFKLRSRPRWCRWPCRSW